MHMPLKQSACHEHTRTACPLEDIRRGRSAGAHRCKSSWSAYDLLVGGGEVPEGSDPSVEPWRASLASGRAASLDDHLVTNEPGYAPRPCGLGAMFSRV